MILPERFDLPDLDDSKALSAGEREILAPAIRSQARAWAVAVGRVAEIERLNILKATFLAMSRAVGRLRLRPRLMLIDGDKVLPPHLPAAALLQRAEVDGDTRIPAISAASILAKTTRDRMMAALDRRFPGYGLALHKGYATAEHRAALDRLGPCPIHRATFRGVRPETERGQACLPGI